MDTHKDEAAIQADETSENRWKSETLRLIDERISRKIAETAALGCEDLDETLSRISQEREKERASLRSRHSVETKPSKVKLAKKQKHSVEPVADTQEGDRRLDAFLDRTIAGLARLRPRLPKPQRRTSMSLLVNLCAWEARMADRAAAAVDRTDAAVDRLFDAGNRVLHRLHRRWQHARLWTARNRRPILAGCTALALLSSSTLYAVEAMTAYEYAYNGKVLGIVKEPADVTATVDVVGDKLSHIYGAEIAIDPAKDITFRKVMDMDLAIDSEDDVLNTLTYLRDMNANAYAICVDGRQVAVLDCKADAEQLLATVQERFTETSDMIRYLSIGFAEKVTVEEVSTKIGAIDPEDRALEYILTGAVEKRLHPVESGETFNAIAKKYGLTPAELQLANPEVQPDRLQIGQELVLNQIVPLVTVQTKEVATYRTAIQYDVTYEETGTLYKGEQTVKSAGIPGQREVIAEVVRENGIEVGRTELSTTILSEPVSQVVLQGTKALPPLIGTGTFIYPTRGTLTSRFGTRWGRLHAGIDIAAPSGTKIRASDGGKVIFAGWDGALGYVVRIDHGQNKVTVYGHCSKLLVKAGDKVYQDQHIANVGNTGRSTGPHVHFEVRVNGVAQNPLKYLQ